MHYKNVIKNTKSLNKYLFLTYPDSIELFGSAPIQNYFYMPNSYGKTNKNLFSFRINEVHLIESVCTFKLYGLGHSSIA